MAVPTCVTTTLDRPCASAAETCTCACVITTPVAVRITPLAPGVLAPRLSVTVPAVPTVWVLPLCGTPLSCEGWLDVCPVLVTPGRSTR